MSKKGALPQSMIMTNHAMDVLEDVKTEAYQDGFEEGIEKGIEKGVEVGQRRKTYFGTYNLLRMDFPPAKISKVFDVPPSFVAAIEKLRVRVPEVKALLQKGNMEMEAIAKKLGVPALFVEAVKLELEKK